MATTQPTTFKPGQKVQAQASRGDAREGKVHAIHLGWVEVNLGDKKNPLLRRYRPGSIVRM